MEQRRLTESEINEILKYIPLLPTAIKEIARFHRRQIVESFRLKLEDAVVKPNIKMIGELLQAQYYDALIQSMTPVGLNASGDIGAKITQLTLDTFHIAGSFQKLASAVESIRQIANNTKKRKEEKTTIHFENFNLAKHEALDIINKMLGVKIFSLFDNFKPVEIISKPNDWWYRTFEETVKQSDVVTNAKECLRMYFNPYLLFKHQITFEDIEEILTESMPQIVCVWSPLTVGVFDIYVDEHLLRALFERNLKKGKAFDLTDDELIEQFRQHEILPAINSKMANINGIEDLDYVHIEEDYILSKVITKKRISVDSDGVLWRLWIDQIETLVKGIPHEKFLELFRQLERYNIKLVKEVKTDLDYHFDVKVSEKYEGEDPLKVIGKLIERADDSLDVTRREQLRNGDYNPSKIDPLYRASRYVYANAKTREFIKILGYPEVNPERTICWNANVVQSTLGIEAACSVIAREFHDVISENGANISAQHLYLIARAMCYTGTIVAITSRGATKQNRGALADASFELPIDAFVNSATFGKKEKLDAVSARIFVGNRCKLGTGGVRVELDQEKLQAMIDRTEKKDSTEIDLSFFERSDLQFIDRNERVINEVGDSMDNFIDSEDYLLDDLATELPNLDEGESTIDLAVGNWLTEELTMRPTPAEPRSINAIIEDVLGDV